jgi:hypothetical protein
MSDLDAELRRYAALSDRLALGERLAPDEHAFLLRMQQRNESCRLEAEFLASLADLDASPNEDTRALVDAALASVNGHSKRASDVSVMPRRRPRNRSRWIALGASVAVAAAALLAVGLRGRDGKSGGAIEPRIELVYVSGEVSVSGAPAAISSRLLREGDVLAVANGGACIAMDPQIDVCATAGTRLRLTSTLGSSRRIDLLQGKVAVQLAPQPEGSRLSIVSDGIWSTAVGTAFTVERDEAAGVQTTVLHGKVRVGESEAKSKLVSAHQRANARRNGSSLGPAEITAISRNDESPDWALLGPTKLWNTSVSATLEVTGAGEALRGAFVVLDGQAIGIAPLATLVPAGTRLVEIRAGGQVVLTQQVVLAAGDRERISLERLKPPVARAMEVAPIEPQILALANEPRVAARAIKARAITPSSAELLRDARKLLREGDLGAAADKYSELVRSYPSSAELELEHLGDASAALDYADRYLAVGGTLTPEARETRVRALRSLGRRSEERAAIEEFLEAHPESLRAPTLTERLSVLTGSSKRSEP